MRTGVIVLVVTICSLWVRELGPLNAIIGGMQVVSYIGVLPGVCGLFLLDRTSIIWRAAMLGLIVFAVVACIVAFFEYLEPHARACSKLFVVMAQLSA